MNKPVLNETYQITWAEQSHCWTVGPIEFTLSFISKADSQNIDFHIESINGYLYIEFLYVVQDDDKKRGAKLDTRMDLSGEDDITETLSFVTQAIDMVHKIMRNEFSQTAGIDIIKNLSLQFVQSLDHDFNSPAHADCEY